MYPCNKINKRLCTQYTKHPNSHSSAVGSAKPLSAKHFTGQQLPNSCRLFTPDCPKLDESNIKSLGHKHYSGVQDRILDTTSTDPFSYSSSLLPEDTHLMTTEIHKLLAISVVPITCTKGFLSEIFLVPKKMVLKDQQ